jgi:hypothetical protein
MSFLPVPKPFGDFRPHFPNHVRDLAPELTRIAVFIVAIGRGPEVDGRKTEDKVVAGCEGASCVIPSPNPVGGGLREGDTNG